MQTQTVTFPDVDSSISSNYYMEDLTLKGTTQVTFDLSLFDNSTRDVIQIVAVYGDGQDHVYNVDVTQSAFVQPITSVTHVYNSQYSTYVTQMSAIFQVIFTNLAIVNYVQPITLLQSSYYDDVGHLHLTSTQLLPVSSNDVLFTCYDDYSNLHNFALRKPQH